MAKNEDITIEEPIKLQEKYRFKKSDLQHLEENLYSISAKKYDKKPENIKLFLANNQYSEIENVAIKSIARVRRYRFYNFPARAVLSG